MATFELRWVRRSPTDDAFTVGRALLQSLVAELTGEAAEAILISAACPDCGGPHGRPSVERSALHVGLSHTATTTAAVASWDGPIGVDIEELPGEPSAIAAIEALTGIPGLRHWTRVEAVLKADGRGLRVDPAAVTMHELDGRVEASITGSDARYHLSQPEIDETIVVSVASRL